MTRFRLVPPRRQASEFLAAGITGTALAVLLTLGSGVRAADTGPAKGNWSIRGVVEPQVQATLSSQLTARIAEVTADSGSRVRKGDVLVAFDCAVERARLKAAEAEADGARARLTSLQRLDKMGSIGRVDVELALAEQKKTAAAAEERRSVVGYCTVTAPFDGLIVDVPVHANESLDYGKPLVSLLDDRSLRLVLLAPSGWAAWLQPSLPLIFSVDETGERLSAHVTHLGARIDATSQTFTVFAAIDRLGKAESAAKKVSLVAGMTGTATFTPPPQ